MQFYLSSNLNIALMKRSTIVAEQLLGLNFTLN